MHRPVRQQGLARWRTSWADVAARLAASSWRWHSWACSSPACSAGVQERRPDVLALNAGKDRVQRTNEKVACRLDARSCGIEKVGQRYLVAGSLVRKRARSGQLGPHRSLVLTAILNSASAADSTVHVAPSWRAAASRCRSLLATFSLRTLPRENGSGRLLPATRGPHGLWSPWHLRC